MYQYIVPGSGIYVDVFRKYLENIKQCAVKHNILISARYIPYVVAL